MRRAISTLIIGALVQGANAWKQSIDLRRRFVVNSVCSALPLLACPPAALASKFPQHVEDLDRAVLLADVGAVQAALRVLGLPAEESAALTMMKHTGTAEEHNVVSSYRVAAASTKVSVSLPSHPMTSAHYVRILWLRNAATGGLLAVRELKPYARGEVKHAMCALLLALPLVTHTLPLHLHGWPIRCHAVHSQGPGANP